MPGAEGASPPQPTNVPGRSGAGRTPAPLEPAPELGALLGLEGLWLKREDLSPDGSHKGRAMDVMVTGLLREGGDQAVISSSGNAALAAGARCREHGLRLLSLVSPSTPGVKLRRLVAAGGSVVISRRPVELLHHAAGAWGLVDLRASTNPLGPVAYRQIAAELAVAGEWAQLFVFSSSGATALGIAQGFGALGASVPTINPVEGDPGGELTRPWYPGAPSAAPAGVGELGTRKSRLAPLLRRAVRASGGRGWRVSRGDLLETRRLAEQVGLHTSWEGLAALAAAHTAAASGVGGKGRCLVLLTGAAWQLDLEPAAEELAPTADSPAELDSILEAAGFRRAP